MRNKVTSRTVIEIISDFTDIDQKVNMMIFRLHFISSSYKARFLGWYKCSSRNFSFVGEFQRKRSRRAHLVLIRTVSSAGNRLKADLKGSGAIDTYETK